LWHEHLQTVMCSMHQLCVPPVDHIALHNSVRPMGLIRSSRKSVLSSGLTDYFQADPQLESFLSALLITNTINLLMLPILWVIVYLSPRRWLTNFTRVLREFRPWLDAARLLFLLIANIGASLVFLP
jgi:hypothetical protein